MVGRNHNGTPPQHGRRRQAGPSARKRMVVVVGLLGLASIGLVARAFDLQVVRKQFYQRQGDARFLREMPIPVSRGTIFDRNGEPLAVSTPVMSIWANPSEVLDNDERIPQLAQALGVDADELKSRLAQRSRSRVRVPAPPDDARKRPRRCWIWAFPASTASANSSASIRPVK